MTEHRRTWRVVLRSWDEYVVGVEARTQEEAEELAIDNYDGLDRSDCGIECLSVEEET